jgi:hypothetical protein
MGEGEENFIEGSYTREERNRKRRKTNNGKRSAIEMTPAKHS